MTQQKNFYPALSGIRILAAWLIFWHHYPQEIPWGWLQSFVKEVHVGIFFTLSGFLSFVLYKEPYLKGNFNFRFFLLNRLSRLVPLFWFLLMITAVWNWKGWFSFSLSFFFIQSYFDVYKFALIGQSWTLPVQLFFYISFPLMLWISQKKGWPIYWCFGFLSIGFLIVYLFSHFSAWGFMDDYRHMLIYTYFGRVTEFTIGAYFGQLFTEKKLKKLDPFKPTIVGGFLYLALTFIIASFQSETHGYGMFHPVGLLIHHLLVPFSLVLLIYGLMVEKTYLFRWLSSRFMTQLGLSAYAFYLIHIGYFSEFIYFKISENILVLFVLLNLLAYLLYRFFELPIHRFLRYRFRTKK